MLNTLVSEEDLMILKKMKEEETTILSKLTTLPTITCPENPEQFKNMFYIQNNNNETQHCYLNITPKSAQMILDNYNPYNRALKAQIELKEAISSGTFIENGDTIRFTSEPNLIDGQHRLQAIIDSNIPLKLQCVFGLKQEAIYAIDKQKNKRTTSDDITILAKRNNNKEHEMSRAEEKVFKAFIDGSNSLKYKNLTDEERNKLWTENYNKAVRFGISCFPTKTASGLGNATQKAIIARAYYCGEDENKLKDFCNNLILGQSTKKGCPVEILYKKLARSKSKVGRNGNQFDKYKMIEISLNAYLNDKEIFKLNTSAWYEFYDIIAADKVKSIKN